MNTKINYASPISYYTNGKFTDSGISLTPGTKAWGPYRDLEAGTYACTFLIDQILEHERERVFIDICCHFERILVQKTPIYQYDNRIFSFNFSLQNDERLVEFRLYNESDKEIIFNGIYISRHDSQLMPMWPDTYLNYESEKNFLSAALNIEKRQDASDEVILFQTADGVRYAKMLEVSSGINKVYCERYELRYEMFSGLAFGDKPFYAMYNRIAFLWFLLQNGFRGWVVYLDADAVIVDFNFNLKSDLVNKRPNKYMVFNYAFESGHQYHYFGNFLSESFALDLSNEYSVALVTSWYNFYRHYLNRHDYINSSHWGEIFHDQISLQHIIYKNKRFLDGVVSFEPIFRQHIYQVPREDMGCESSIDDLERRIQKLVDIKTSMEWPDQE